MNEMLLVITNMPDVASAHALARQIIEARAAACVNQLAPCTSVYRWQDKIETVTEVPLLIKTTRSAYARLETLIRAVHPYELPEIIALPVTQVLSEYLNWVNSETRISKE
jgi:periplasmic divalent cation tolerance protein